MGVNRESYRYYIDKQQSLYENYARKNGIQGKCMRILMCLYDCEDGLSQNDIVKRTYSTKQVVHATIKKLAYQGYVQLREQEKDRRHKVLILTSEGKDYAASILDPLRQMEDEAMAALTPDDQKQYEVLTKQYTERLAYLMGQGGSRV